MDKPAYIGKRMRELLEGASIGIIPYPIKDDCFGTRDERFGSMRRYLILGYEQDDSTILWSIYSFRPRESVWKYAFDMAAIEDYEKLFADGHEATAEELKKHEYSVAIACTTATRENGLLWYFVVEDEDDICAEEHRISKTMRDNPELINRPHVVELIESVCGREVVSMKKNALNIWGDYGFLWNDFGYFVESKFLCHDGLEKTKSYTVHWALKSDMNRVS
jgi:hypothetical protein